MVAAGLLAKKAVERGLDVPAVGEDHPGARLDGRHRLPRPRRASTSTSTSSGSTSSATAARPASATRGPLPEEISDGGQRPRPGRLRGAVRQPQLRGPDQPGRARQLPRLAAAVRRLRAGRHGWTSTCSPSRSARAPTASRSTCATSGRRARRSSRRVDERDPLRHVPQELRRRLHGRRALELARDPRGRPLRVDATRPTSASRPSSTAWTPSRSRREPIEGARVLARARATASPPTTSRRPARSRRTARPAAS